MIDRPTPTSGSWTGCWRPRTSASGSARHWMDVARFAESHGYEQDYDRPFAYHYRDFLIRAFNAGHALRPVRPLAARRRRAGARRPDGDGGDRVPRGGGLPHAAHRGRVRVGPVQRAGRHGLHDRRGVPGPLGRLRPLPRSQVSIRSPRDDYYRLAAAFTTTIRSEIDVAMGPGAKPAKVQVTAEGFPHTKHHADDAASRTSIRRRMCCSGATSHQKKGEAAPGVIRVLTGGKDDGALARGAVPRLDAVPAIARCVAGAWLTDPVGRAGRLAARVIVNRLWQHHFGRGIVATPNDFGAQGDRRRIPSCSTGWPPSWSQDGWRLKRIHG